MQYLTRKEAYETYNQAIYEIQRQKKKRRSILQLRKKRNIKTIRKTRKVQTKEDTTHRQLYKELERQAPPQINTSRSIIGGLRGRQTHEFYAFRVWATG